MKAALFDLDGVLIDSEGQYSEFWREVGARYGKPADFAAQIKGTTLAMILSQFDESAHPALRQELIDVEETMLYPLYPGVEEFLQQLNDAGIPCAIVTSSNLNKMRRLWLQQPQLRRYFDAVITDEDVTRSKPDPEPYRRGAEALGCDPADTVVFEDALNGLRSGLAAGARVVALTTTNPADALRPLAHAVIDSFEGLTISRLTSLLS